VGKTFLSPSRQKKAQIGEMLENEPFIVQLIGNSQTTGFWVQASNFRVQCLR
jgi:hypothetical protein